MKSLNIIQRIFAETPPFWRAVQIICLVISLIIDHLATAGYVSHSVQLVLDGGLGVGAALAQFAVEEKAKLQAMLADPAQALLILPTLTDQIKEAIETFKNPPAVTLGTILQAAEQPVAGEQIQTGQPVAPAAPAPVYVPNPEKV